MTCNHWTVFNGGGAVVADNLSYDEMAEYMSEERFDRRWHAVYCVLVKNMSELRDARPAPLPALREETVYEKSARWAWPDGRPDL